MKRRLWIGVVVCLLMSLVCFQGVSAKESTLASFNTEESTIEVYSTKDFEINDYGELVKYTGEESEVTIPNNVKSIGYAAFEGCSSVEKIILPEGLEAIESSAFRDCTKLTEINLPSTLIDLSNSAFDGCSSLKEITIPKGITDYYWYRFADDSSIERIHVAEDNEAYSSIDGVVFNKDKTVIIHYPINRKDDTYVIPDSVTDLSEVDFYKAKYLKHLVFGKNVTADKNSYGFNGSSFMNGALESYTVPSDNKSFCDIDGVLFTKDQKELIAYPEKRPGAIYVVPKGTTTLGLWSFGKDSETTMELRYILIPNSVDDIGFSVGYIGYEDGMGPNDELTLFGMKDSVVETYAKGNYMNYGVYDSSSKKRQLLLSNSNLAMEVKASTKLESIQVPFGSDEAITWKSSKSSVVNVKNGKLTAQGTGKATITATTNSGAAATCEVLVKLASPTNIKIGNASASSDDIKLSWDKVDGAKGYHIYTFDSWSWSREKVGTTTKTSFTFKNKEVNQYYYFMIQAYSSNSEYNSDYSEEVFILIPQKPTKAKATQKTSTSAKITWTGSERYNTGGYVIYRATSKDGKYTRVGTVTGNSTWSFTDTKLTSGKTYYYKVRTYEEVNNKNVYSSYSKPATIKMK